MAELQLRDDVGRNILVISSQASIEQALAHSPATTLIIVDQDGLPRGVIPPDALQALARAGADQPVQAYQQLWLPPTLTHLDAALSILLAARDYSPFIRWHVVADGQSIIGVVSPVQLPRPALDKAYDETRDVTRSFGDSLFGDPIAPPPSLCYRCTAATAHHISPEVVEEFDVRGYALCPNHRTIMLAENPCQRGPASCS